MQKHEQKSDKRCQQGEAERSLQLCQNTEEIELSNEEFNAVK